MDKATVKKLVEDKRLKDKRRVFDTSLKNYRIALSRVLGETDADALKNRARRIKEFSIDNLNDLKKEMIRKMEESGITVHEASSSKEAREIVREIIGSESIVVKSKSNVMREIRLVEYLRSEGIDVVETDCGDFLVDLCEEKDIHPVLPAAHIRLNEIVKKIRQKTGAKVEESAESILAFVRSYLRERITKARVGITGANVLTAEGAIVILENEGNISLVSRLPEKHVVVATIDKIVPTLEDAMVICRAQSIWGTGLHMPSYINVISSPSATADIGGVKLVGAQGPKEVHLVLVDNGRSKIINSDFREALYCINCGACLAACPVYGVLLNNYGGDAYHGGIGIVKTYCFEGLKEAFDRGVYLCTTCGACREMCPLGINIPEMVRKIREECVRNKFELASNVEMIENTRKYGNPFGKVEGSEALEPDKMYCC